MSVTSKGPCAAPIARKPGEVPGVAAVEDAMPRTRDDPGAPERRVAVREAAPREVPGRRRRDRQIADGGLLLPVELPDLRRRHAPLLQVRADAQRHEQERAAARERLHRLHVEVVVVVVRDQDGVERRQVRERDRRREEPLRPEQRRRRNPLAPDRVRQDAPPVDLDERAGVAHPRDAQPGRRRRVVVGAGPRDDRDRALRIADLVTAELQAQRRRYLVRLHGARRLGVPETPGRPVPGAARAREPLAGERAPERREPAGGLRGRHGHGARRGQQRQAGRTDRATAPVAHGPILCGPPPALSPGAGGEGAASVFRASSGTPRATPSCSWACPRSGRAPSSPGPRGRGSPRRTSWRARRAGRS